MKSDAASNGRLAFYSESPVNCRRAPSPISLFLFSVFPWWLLLVTYGAEEGILFLSRV